MGIVLETIQAAATMAAREHDARSRVTGVEDRRRYCGSGALGSDCSGRALTIRARHQCLAPRRRLADQQGLGLQRRARTYGFGRADTVRGDARTSPRYAGLPSGPSGRAALNGLIDQTEPRDYLLVDLGSGESWLTSRLFIFCEVLAPLRGLRYVVFVSSSLSGLRRYVGLAPVNEAVRQLSASRNVPQNSAVHHIGGPGNAYQIALEHALRELAFGIRAPSVYRAEATEASRTGAPTVYRAAPDVARDPSAVTSHTLRLSAAALDVTAAHNLLDLFLLHPLVRQPGTWKQPADESWIPVEKGAYLERAQWLSPSNLTSIFGSSLDLAFVSEDIDDADIARHVRRCRLDAIPLVDARFRFTRLIERTAILESVAGSAGGGS